MKTVVQIIFSRGAETAKQFTRVFDGADGIVPLSTADAICLALDEMEVAGLPVDKFTGLAIVAKRGLGADALLSFHHAGTVQGAACAP